MRVSFGYGVPKMDFHTSKMTDSEHIFRSFDSMSITLELADYLLSIFEFLVVLR